MLTLFYSFFAAFDLSKSPFLKKKSMVFFLVVTSFELDGGGV